MSSLDDAEADDGTGTGGDDARDADVDGHAAGTDAAGEGDDGIPAGEESERGREAGARTVPRGRPDGSDCSELYVDDVALSYGTAEPVVEAETLVVPAGEVTALVGPNGSGKSTLLRAMAGEKTPDRGSVLLDGREVEAFGAKELARTLGMLSQENVAPDSTTVRELAMHGRYPHRGFFEQVDEGDERAVDHALERVGVDGLSDRPVGDLSGGQKQLAWLAMVLAQETDVLLLDEPTTYLDLHHQLRVLEAVRELNAERGVTVAVVLHDIGQAARFADNLVALKDGEPYDWGPPDEVVTTDLVREVFGVEADVGFGPEGPTVTPRRPLGEGSD